MVKSQARTQDLLRQQARQRRRLQVWLALTVIWGVVLGWVMFGLVNSVTEDSDLPFAWGAYAVPLIVLGIGSLLAHRRLRRIGDGLLAIAEEEQAARAHQRARREE